jgi:DUF1009 family protein
VASLGGQVLGLIAGRGGLPLAIARSARARGRPVAVVAYRNETDPRIEGEAAAVTWLLPGQIGAALASLRSAGVREAVLAGGVAKGSLVRGAEALRLDGDARALLARLADRRDGSILGAIADYLADGGIRLLPQAELVPELIAAPGPLCGKPLEGAQLRDIAFAWPIARAVADLDVGQTVIVKDGAVLAVEAIEGTDAAIRRAAGFGPGATVVKVARPQQDPRFDLPTVGPETIAVLAEARAAALAVEAGATLVLEREATVAAAVAAGIAVLGVPRDGPGPASAAS